MNKTRKDALFLIFQTILAAAYHIGFPILKTYLQQLKKIEKMKEFNNLLDQNLVSFNVLKSLKILIHNFESLENKEILNSSDIKELELAVLNLNVKHQKIFLKSTPTLNLVVIGATVLPCFAYFIKNVLNKKQKTIN